ncbi:CinA family protein [Aureimonas populi]|uniref:CinA family protein n=1 Tax=Aureimonas populi TaxID=1701758 RepID=A0ABW5CQ66_9HYPH|nr:CinA family protein [Aureimonas populi]
MSGFDDALLKRAALLIERAGARGTRIATAESCTGGLVAALLTEIPGSSKVVDRGFVTYSNAAKAELLDIDPALIETEGAVSKLVAQAMAKGALAASRAQLSVSVTGVAGPGGGTERKPVGLVHFAGAVDGHVHHVEKRFGDLGRAGIRNASVETALGILEQLLER